MLEFKNKQQLMGYTSKMKKTLKDGELAHLEKEEKMFVWKDDNWSELKTEGHSNVQMTMYEVNKQIMSQLPGHNKDEIKKDIETINKFYEVEKSSFYMLLCKEESYYTVLKRNNDTSDRLGPTVIDLLIEIDHSILSVENLNNAEVEIWSRDKEDNIWCSHLFNYDIGVVDFGG